MRKTKDVLGWTDYPIEELGDIPGKRAPVRQVKLVKFDGDKYVDVLVVECGTFTQFKRCYFYSSPGRCGNVEVVSLAEIEMFNSDSDY